MRARPVWDIIMLTLMLGGLALTTTGFYLALRRIRNDMMLLVRFIGRRKPTPAECTQNADNKAGALKEALQNVRYVGARIEDINLK